MPWKPTVGEKILFGRARMKTWELLVTMLLCLLLLYTGSYGLLSLGGRYEPAVIGLNGVKWYDWAPRGFVTDYNWNEGINRFYLPLWALDRRLWHSYEEADSGKYPINEVPPEDIGKVYRAWMEVPNEK